MPRNQPGTPRPASPKPASWLLGNGVGCLRVRTGGPRNGRPSVGRPGWGVPHQAPGGLQHVTQTQAQLGKWCLASWHRFYLGKRPSWGRYGAFLSPTPTPGPAAGSYAPRAPAACLSTGGLDLGPRSARWAVGLHHGAQIH